MGWEENGGTIRALRSLAIVVSSDRTHVGNITLDQRSINDFLPASTFGLDPCHLCCNPDNQRQNNLIQFVNVLHIIIGLSVALPLWPTCPDLRFNSPAVSRAQLFLQKMLHIYARGRKASVAGRPAMFAPRSRHLPDLMIPTKIVTDPHPISIRAVW
ncbi:hypothetical protein BDN72DRAFT_431375 [Pluteus cervinus]|uniref:Uncharacterized protein n=1 Tax=Pluteus cervinus TaxID=181527 RepID=A0ACD3A8P1_9AGAR|nr:hypothetical protein BDN72DRAFT_431375 [Pluteus cervinus]